MLYASDTAMVKDKRQFWFKAAMIAAAIVLPFGTVIIIAVAAARARRARRSDQVYEEWWRLRDVARAESRPTRNGRYDREAGRPQYATSHRDQ
jgi:hypothetical protein